MRYLCQMIRIFLQTKFRYTSAEDSTRPSIPENFWRGSPGLPQTPMVKKGAKLMVYEAMKMKNIISAPFDAIVKSVEVKVGDKLPKGAVLVYLE